MVKIIIKDLMCEKNTSKFGEIVVSYAGAR